MCFTDPFPDGLPRSTVRERVSDVGHRGRREIAIQASSAFKEVHLQANDDAQDGQGDVRESMSRNTPLSSEQSGKSGLGQYNASGDAHCGGFDLSCDRDFEMFSEYCAQLALLL